MQLPHANRAAKSNCIGPTGRNSLLEIFSLRVGVYCSFARVCCAHGVVTCVFPIALYTKPTDTRASRKIIDVNGDVSTVNVHAYAKTHFRFLQTALFLGMSALFDPFHQYVKQ